MEYKLCILAAGKGSRSNRYKNLHKALLPVENRPAISWIIDRVDSSVPIVVAIGFLGEQIVSYLNFVHPNRQIEYVWVDNYDQPGSGPGYSLMQCIDSLQCPFVVTAVDTIIKEDITYPSDNWIGVKKVKDCRQYCLYSPERGFHYDESQTNALAFIGMGGVLDFEDFWRSLANKKTIKNEHQMTNGFEHLPSLSFREFTWFDVGNDDSYKQTIESFNKPIVAEKEKEILYIDNGKVVKFFASADIVERRTKRLEYLKNSPQTTRLHSNMYGYEFVSGSTLSQANSSQIDMFFDFCRSFFTPSGNKNSAFKEDCRAMYSGKTFARVKSLVNTDIDMISSVNGEQVAPIIDILEEIDWEDIIEKAIPYFFHGDFQTENIIVSNDSVCLIDWRDAFGESLVFGDMYYDLGKLYHSIPIIGANSEELTFSEDSLLLNKLRLFCESKSLDWRHVQLLGYLQYVTIASMYEDDSWKKFYFLLGKMKLSQWLSS